VWHGEQSILERYRDGAAGNQIHTRFEKGWKNAIFVLPEDEVRAGEIGKRNVEGARRSRLFAVAHQTSSAWLRAHSGWTALVAVCVDRGSPAVLARHRVISLKLSRMKFRQPYHTAKKMPPDEGANHLAEQEEARRLAYAQFCDFNPIAKTGAETHAMRLLLASGKPLPICTDSCFPCAPTPRTVNSSRSSSPCQRSFVASAISE